MFYKKIEPLQHQSIVKNSSGKLSVISAGTVSYIFWNETYTVVPVDMKSTSFTIQHQSLDFIELCFKGIIDFIISEPITAVQMFDFNDVHEGIQAIKNKLEDHCRGELRDIASNLTMERAIKERNEAINRELQERIIKIVSGDTGLKSWGIKVKVSTQQVYPTDPEIRRQIKAETMNAYLKQEEASRIATQEDIQKKEIDSKKRIDEENFMAEREDYARENEKLDLEKIKREKKLANDNQIKKLESDLMREEILRQKETDKEKILAETFIETLASEESIKRFESQKQALNVQREIEELKNQNDRIKLDTEIRRERAFCELRQEMLPFENMTEIAEALANTFTGSHLSIYGDNSDILRPVTFLTDLIADRFKPSINKTE